MKLPILGNADSWFPIESIVESPFKETTRNGKHTLRSVLLALTPGVLLITESRSGQQVKLNSQESKYPSFYLVNSLKLTVFKKSQRQTLKICFGNETYRYFELKKTRSKKVSRARYIFHTFTCRAHNENFEEPKSTIRHLQMMWAMWCKQVIEIEHRNTKIRWLEKLSDKTISLDWSVVNQKRKPQRFIWNDKYLYLGSRRELEDQSRPSPVPGLGRTDNIKLLYLKPQYFGCWDQSEHWVQCESSSKHFNLDYDESKRLAD